jgi:hypothetical protein
VVRTQNGWTSQTVKVQKHKPRTLSYHRHGSVKNAFFSSKCCIFFTFPAPAAKEMTAKGKNGSAVSRITAELVISTSACFDGRAFADCLIRSIAAVLHYVAPERLVEALISISAQNFFYMFFYHIVKNVVIIFLAFVIEFKLFPMQSI